MNENIEQNQEVKQSAEGQPQEQSQANSVEEQQPDSASAFHLEGILGKRLVATFIDFILVGVAAMIITFPAYFVLPSSPVNLGALASAIVWGLAAAAILLKDTPFQAGPFDGQTPGKKAMGIRVTDMNKKPITSQQSIKRNLIPASGYVLAAISSLLNVIRIPIISGMMGFFIILPLMGISFLAILFEVYKIYSGPQNRRWGDTLAGTIVALD
ncbi:MAG: RDD family protein [Candidatus Rifleibacteriota bacterium]